MNDNGMYFYEPSEGAGNLVGSWTNEDGTDEYGNPVFQGIVNYSGNEYVQIAFGNLLLGCLEDPAAPYGPTPGSVSIIGDNSAITLISPWTNALPKYSTLWMSAGTTWAYGKPTSAHIRMDNDIWAFSGMRKVYNPTTGPLPIPYVWQNPTYSTGWAGTTSLHGNSGFSPLQFHMLPGDEVKVYGAATYTGTGTGTTIFTLPAAGADGQDSYRPPAGNRGLLPCYINHGGTPVSGWAQVTEAGAVAVNSTLSGVAVAAGDEVFINGTYSLRQFD